MTGQDVDVDVDERPWRARLRRWAVEALKLVALFLVVSAVVGWLRGPRLAEAPPLSLPTVQGDHVDLAALRGGPVVVNFWATWCAPCRVELPTLSAFAAAHPDVPVIGVAVDDVAAVRRVVTREGIAFPVVVADGEVARAWQVGAFPTTFVLDAEGRVVTSHTGIIVRPWLEALVAWAGW